ncbi:MAG: adenylosuccinate lyase [Geodermatophilaceae bacterium]|nr:adenylosuccinate lyase [Geodermatophilaceae bacterium]
MRLVNPVSGSILPGPVCHRGVVVDEPTLSPLDGRYRQLVSGIADHLSEQALNRGRLEVEVAWLSYLAAGRVMPELREFTADEQSLLRNLVADFGSEQAVSLAVIERRTGHDVKAVEYYIKQALADTSLADVMEFVHFGCTSEDINNLAYGRMLQRAITDVWLPSALGLVADLRDLALAQRDQPMLSRTHGQAATPTTVGKEIAVFVHRLDRQLARIQAQEYLGKFNGATGTYSAHHVAAPEVDWIEISRGFVQSLGLTWNSLTTQIESHDYMCELFADLARFNGILNNLNTDMWSYISLGLFRQRPTAGAVGSSTMPHKINPIRFENSEANLEVSNSLLQVLQTSLITSRMQRDLSDSSMQRNIGPALGYALIGIVNTRTGLRSLDVDSEALAAELDDAWEVLAEAVQSVMRRRGLDQPYERLKELTRGQRITREGLQDFICQLHLPAEDEQRLLDLSPANYLGLASRLVDFIDVPSPP